MIKQTLFFSNPAYLSVKNRQLSIRITNENKEQLVSRPIEDIGIVILDHSRITLTHNSIKALQDNNTVIISCNDKHMPHSIMLPMEGNTLQSERFRAQIQVSLPLKKNLWKQTVEAKITNQLAALKKLNKPTKRLEVLITRVQSGDPENIEGQAAAYYWSQLFDGFTRDRYGMPPNNLLNYGYAVLRAMVARALVSAGLHLTLGIHHKNKYNAFCLADDIMEPFRPFIDLIVFNMFDSVNTESDISIAQKQKLLSISQVDALYEKKKSPLMVGMTTTAASLYHCYIGKKRKIEYPKII